MDDFRKLTPEEEYNHLHPKPSKEQLIKEADFEKHLLLSNANNCIAPLQDAIDLDIATDAEKQKLTEWKKYRVQLNRVDCSTVPEINWPEKPE
ncbi:tail fiber assembly protein [Photorhabdus sp. APURE]|nr:tail fiber assembly protein [Photorhabdus aballayi]